jgi:tetratricopeptide (TPR) repeat protein
MASLGLIKAQLKLIRKDADVNERAIKYYEKLISENAGHPKLAEAKLTLVSYYKKTNNFAEALRCLKSIEASQSSESVSLELAELFNKQDSLYRAADQYRGILQSYPASRRRYHVIRELSKIEGKLGRKENRVLFLKMLVDNYPQIEHIAEKSEIIQFFLDQGKIADAEVYISETAQNAAIRDIVLATEFKQNENEYLLQLARLYDAKNDHTKAIRYYQDYIRLSASSKNDDDSYHAIGQIYIEENRFDQAVSYFERIQPSYPEYEKIEQSLAVIYFKNENYKKAAEYGKRVMTRLDKNNPSFIVINRNYLISLIKSQGLTNFRTQLKSYQKQFPNDREGHARLLYEYAMQERKSKNYTRSNKLMDEIIDDYDSSSYVDDATYMKGLNYIVVNNFEKAMEIFTEFPEDFPNSSILDQYYNSLGAILEQFGKNDDAIVAYQNALRKSSSVKTKKLSYAKLISLYNKLGLSESVLSTASTYIQLYPTDEKAFNIKILIGQALSNMSRGTEAVSYFKELKLEASSESEPEIQYWIANTYYKMGSYEAAISEFIKIPLLSKKTKLQWVPSALYYAGQSYEKLGKNDDAIRMYQKIISTAGIDSVFKNDAKKRINQLKAG